MSKTTGELSVIADSGMTEKQVNIHPNDGYDLGLMVLSHVVRIFVGVPTEQFESEQGPHVFGNLELRNECRMGTCEVSRKSAEKLGGARTVKVVYDAGIQDSYGKILLQPVAGE